MSTPFRRAESGPYQGRLILKKTAHMLPEEGVQCRVTIRGTYKGKPFVYIDPEDSKGSQFIWGDDPSTYWWEEGNFACDCNRSSFVPDAPQDQCGSEIQIDSITPLDPTLPALYLNETGPHPEPE